MVRWECCCFKWQETIVHADGPHEQFPRGFSSALAEECPTIAMCTRLIDDYNERVLTYTEDALPAIAGLLTVLGQKLLGGFLFGLPIMFFEAALNWTAKAYQGPRETTRRLPTLKNPGVPQPCLPSWSWIGWEGQIYDDATDDDFNFHATNDRIYTIPITKWSTAASQLEPKRHVDSWFLRDRDRFKDHMNQPLPPGWTRYTSGAEIALPTSRTISLSGVAHGKVIPGENHSIVIQPPEGCGGAIYRHESCASNKFWYPFPLPTPGQLAISPPQTAQLFCETHRFFFNVESPPSEKCKGVVPGQRMAYLYTATIGQFAGVLFYQNRFDHQDLMAKRTSGEKVEVVATSRGYARKTASMIDRVDRHFRVRCGASQSQEEKQELEDTVVVDIDEWYNVLWVEWVDGVAYRRCLGRILKDIWEAQELGPISLVLG